MILSKRMKLWVITSLGSVIGVIVLSETLLRILVPLSFIVDQNDVYPKIWYLENFDSVRSQNGHPINKSHSTLGWTHRPNLRIRNFSTNSLGLRGRREYSFDKATGTKRVVVLGDSFTAGYGVSDEETYSSQLEKLVPESEFLNLGVSGYGVDQAVLRWETLGYKFKPDIVILGIFIPDFHRNVATWWFAAPKPRFNVVNNKLSLANDNLPPIEDFEGNEQRLRKELHHLLNMPRVLIASSYVLERLSRRFHNSREADQTFIEKQRILELLIQRLAEDCARRDVDLVIVTIPTEFYSYPDEDRILSLIAKASSENSVALLQLDRFLGTNPAEGIGSPVFDPATGHWSAAGHKRAANQIATFLRAHTTIE